MVRIVFTDVTLNILCLNDRQRKRIAQNFQILRQFLTEQEDQSIFLSFQFQTPFQILKAGFDSYVIKTPNKENDQIVESSGFKLNPSKYMDGGREMLLLQISVLIPYVASLIATILITKYVMEKIIEYRKALFLATIEGQRLSRIEPFSELAQVPRALEIHVNDMVGLAPASAHLQSKFKGNLLKIISFFEIEERKPIAKYTQWACKARPTPSNWMIDLKNYVFQNYSDFVRLPSTENADDDEIEHSGAQESFKCYMFKSMERKYARKVCFADYVLKNVNQRPEKDQGAEMRAACKPTRPFVDVGGTVRVKYEKHSEEHSEKNSERFAFVADSGNSRNIFDYVVLRFSHLVCVHSGDEEEPRKRVCVSCKEVERRLGFDNAVGYCVKVVSNVDRKTLTGTCQFELYALDTFMKLELPVLESLGPEIEFTLDDPYIIEDNFIDFAFKHNAFENARLAEIVKRIYDGKKRRSGFNKIKEMFTGLKNKIKQRSARVTPQSNQTETVPEEESNQTETVPEEESNQTETVPEEESNQTETVSEKKSNDTLPVPPISGNVRWNPYADRIILAIVTMYYESVESYRGIVTSTGIEGFCDLLIVNGSLNLAKWKALGTIDQIMDEYQKSQSTKPTQNQSSRIPALCVLEAGETLKIVCQQKNIDEKLNSTSLHGVDFHADFSLHHDGPTAVTKERSDIKPEGCAWPLKSCILDAKHRFYETIKWKDFQPGCNFELDPLGTGKCRVTTADKRHQIAGPEKEKEKHHILVEIQSDSKDQKPVESNCHMHVHCFHALQHQVDALSTDDFEENNVQMSLYSNQLLDAYKPKGLAQSLQSVLIHVCFCGIAVCPTLFFFIFWGINTVNVYLLHWHWTPGFFFFCYSMIFFGIVAVYLSLSYLDFPFLFYAKQGGHGYKLPFLSSFAKFFKLHYFLFSPLIGTA
jgi:hypothetical protein